LLVSTYSLGLQVQQEPKTYKGPWHCVTSIYNKHGLKGIYKGQVPTIYREFVGYGIYFALYEYLIQQSCQSTGKQRDELETWRVSAFGALAGYALWITVFPMDVVKSKIQTDSMGKERQFSSMADCFRKTYAAQGIRGFYRGLVPCLLRAAPANAATFVGFELAMRVLK
jgi:solute carrier family 25 carnitine/acylcarnitine transporter 20/29